MNTVVSQHKNRWFTSPEQNKDEKKEKRESSWLCFAVVVMTADVVAQHGDTAFDSPGVTNALSPSTPSHTPRRTRIRREERKGRSVNTNRRKNYMS